MIIIVVHIGMIKKRFMKMKNESLEKKLVEIDEVDFNIGMQELVDYYSVQYSEAVTAVADIEASGAEEVYNFVQNAAMVLQESKTVTEAKALSAIDERVDEARQLWLEKDAIRKMTHHLLKSYQSKVQAMSREMSRRAFVLDKEKLAF